MTGFKAPKSGSIGDKIAQLLCNEGPKGYKQVAECMTGEMSVKNVRAALAYMRKEEWLEMREDKYAPTPEIRQHYGIEESSPVVPPRTASASRPLQAKNIPCLNPLLQGRFRTDIEFKTGSTDFYRIIGYRP